MRRNKKLQELNVHVLEEAKSSKLNKPFKKLKKFLKLQGQQLKNKIEVHAFLVANLGMPKRNVIFLESKKLLQ